MRTSTTRQSRLGTEGRALTWILILLGIVAFAIVLVAFVVPIKSVYIALPVAGDNPNAKAASDYFWSVFHGDRYDELPALLQKLNSGFDGDKQPVMSNLLGAAHLWRFQERRRIQKTAAEMRDDLVRAAEYADMSLAADPSNEFAPAIRVTARWQLAVLDGKPEELPAIELEILENTQAVPSFHGFVQGWLLSAMLPVGSPNYRESPEGFQLLSSACAGFTTPPNQKFNGLIYAFLAIRSWAIDRLCYNNPVAPHNLEGTFLATGDMKVKQGLFDEARIWYGNAQAAPTYSTWPSRHMVEQRMASDFKALQAKFVADTGKLDVVDPAMSFQSTAGCSNCHAK